MTLTQQLASEKRRPALDRSRQNEPVVDPSDFVGGAWETMLRELDLPLDACNPGSQPPPLLRHNIAAVLDGRIKGKVPHLVVMIRTFKPTGHDAATTLQDLTGVMKGTIHRKVLDM